MIIIVTVAELKLNRWKVTFTDTPHELVVSEVIHVAFAVTDCLIGLYRKVFILLYPAVVRLTTQTSFFAGASLRYPIHAETGALSPDVSGFAPVSACRACS